MKKLLAAVLMLGFLAACNTEKESSEPKQASYSGTLTVTDAKGAVTYQASGVRFGIIEQNAIFSLEMSEVKFDSHMPQPFTIVITNLIGKANKDITELESAVQPIVPLIGGTPYESYQIPLFKGSVSGKSLTIEFRCVNAKFRLDHTAVYTGTRTN